LVKTIPSV